MVGVIQERGHLRQEAEDEGEEAKANAADGHEGGGINAERIFVFFVDEPEEGGFHTESEHHEQKRRVAVDLGNHTVAARCSGEFGGVDRHQKVIEETADDAAQAVDGRVFGQ